MPNVQKITEHLGNKGHTLRLDNRRYNLLDSNKNSSRKGINNNKTDRTIGLDYYMNSSTKNKQYINFSNTQNQNMTHHLKDKFYFRKTSQSRTPGATTGKKYLNMTEKDPTKISFSREDIKIKSTFLKINRRRDPEKRSKLSNRF
jgi:hypothetical protein